MGKINWGRVFLGGLLAGVVINLSEFLFHAVVFRTQMEEAMRALGKDPTAAMGGSTVVVWIIWGFLAGIGAVWGYAAIRPRFGPGAKTAAIAGLAVWFFAYFLSSVSMMNMGILPQNLLVIGLVWSLVEALIATEAGAWLYKEA